MPKYSKNYIIAFLLLIPLILLFNIFSSPSFSPFLTNNNNNNNTMATINQETIALINKWVSEDPNTQIVIGIDIGATNTRVAVARHKDGEASSAYSVISKFEADDADILYPNFATIGAALPIPAASACIDAAGPILDEGSRVIITNWAETKNRELRLDLLDERLCPRGRTALLNDLEAACYGVMALGEASQLGNYFENFEDAKANVTGLAPKHHLVLAMGTGLGVGLLLHHSGVSGFDVIPTEFGHTLITQYGRTYPHGESDEAFIKWLGENVWEGKHLAEFEDVCSGRGLHAAYRWICRDSPEREAEKKMPKDVAELAKEGDKLALDAMYLHYKFLFRVAQNICVGMQTKGVILAGDNQVFNNWFVMSVKERLMEEFKWHPKQNPKDKWLENIPILVQTKSVNTNMIGCICKGKIIISN